MRAGRPNQINQINQIRRRIRSSITDLLITAGLKVVRGKDWRVMHGSERWGSFAAGAVCAIMALRLSDAWRQRQRERRRDQDGGDHEADWVSVVSEPLTAETLIARVASPKAGAIVTFSGVTRDNFDGREVVRLEYEGFAPMAEREMAKICRELREKWPDVTKIAMAHRTGLCPVQEASVIIAVSSPHRKDALEAAHFAIDTLKATVPIWKKEFYAAAGGEGAWKENKEWHKQRSAQSRGKQ